MPRLDAFMARAGQARDVTACTAHSPAAGALFVNIWYFVVRQVLFPADFTTFSHVLAGIECGS